LVSCRWRPEEGEALDLDLVTRAKARDREAFEMLVERHAADTYRLAAAIVGTDDAADVAQESFVAAWQQLSRLRDVDAFTPWLRRITVNRARNWLRTRGRRPRAAIVLEGDEGASIADPGSDFRAAAEARAILEPAFESLTPDQRAVLALHYTLGLSIADAAEALGIRVGTAKSRLSGGLAVLRRALEDPGRDVETEVVT
jgi:RNA polymerase sigma factor (sigma-70 family)